MKREGGEKMAAYRIAICEDETVLAEDIAARCEALFAAQNVETEVTCYTSAETLRQYLETQTARKADGEEGMGDYDLYLLDICMAEGDSAGLALAQWLFDNGVRDKVIFITGHAEYALAGYSAHPLHYLLKPVDDAALKEALQLAWTQHGPQTLTLRSGKRTLSLPLAEIRYCESQGHSVVVHLARDTRTFARSLRELEAMLPAGQFARCHKSYLVNLAWVDGIERPNVHLRDGNLLPVSRNYYIAFQTAFISYLNHNI